MDHFGPKNGSAVRVFVNFAQWNRPTVDESNSNGLQKKKIVQDKCPISCPKMSHPDNSGPALKILLKFCRMKGANRYMKILLFFREKI